MGIELLLLILIFILIIQYIWSIQNNKNIKIIQDQIKILLKDVNSDFRDAELFAIAGTALGCLRHKDIIPWDDDVDLGIDESNVDRFLEIGRQKRYKITETSFGYKIWSNNQIFIDIFVMGDRNGKYAYLDDWAYNIFNREYFHKKQDVFPTRECKFGDLSIPVPNSINEYCDRSFPNWHKLCIIKAPHYINYTILDKVLNIFKFELNPFIAKSIEFKN